MKLIGISILFLLLCSFQFIELESIKQVNELSLSIALNEAGTVETGTNNGAVVKYLRAVNLSAGNPYCQAGQYWSFDVAIDSIKRMYGVQYKVPFIKSGSSMAVYKRAKSIGKISYKNTVERGDLIYWIQPNKVNGHVERIVSVGSKGWINTIGFNVSNPNNPKQEGVFIKKRNYLQVMSRMKVLGFIRLKIK